MPNPQKSEVHESTADASTMPTGGADEELTRTTRSAPAPHPPDRVAPIPPQDVQIVDDQTDDAGPLKIKSSDPDLNPPQAPKNPFPTDRTPQIDPPVE